FSIRRRHTSFDCHWSSDVCSSDLDQQSPEPLEIRRGIHLVSLVSRATWCGPLNDETPRRLRLGYGALKTGPGGELRRAGDGGSRSEERRAGKEGRCPWAPEGDEIS